MDYTKIGDIYHITDTLFKSADALYENKKTIYKITTQYSKKNRDNILNAINTLDTDANEYKTKKYNLGNIIVIPPFDEIWYILEDLTYDFEKNVLPLHKNKAHISESSVFEIFKKEIVKPMHDLYISNKQIGDAIHYGDRFYDIFAKNTTGNTYIDYLLSSNFSFDYLNDYMNLIIDLYKQYIDKEMPLSKKNIKALLKTGETAYYINIIWSRICDPFVYTKHFLKLSKGNYDYIFNVINDVDKHKSDCNDALRMRIETSIEDYKTQISDIMKDARSRDFNQENWVSNENAINLGHNYIENVLLSRLNTVSASAYLLHKDVVDYLDSKYPTKYESSKFGSTKQQPSQTSSSFPISFSISSYSSPSSLLFGLPSNQTPSQNSSNISFFSSPSSQTPSSSSIPILLHLDGQTKHTNPQIKLQTKQELISDITKKMQNVSKYASVMDIYLNSLDQTQLNKLSNELAKNDNALDNADNALDNAITSLMSNFEKGILKSDISTSNISKETPTVRMMFELLNESLGSYSGKPDINIARCASGLGLISSKNPTKMNITDIIDGIRRREVLARIYYKSKSNGEYTENINKLYEILDKNFPPKSE
jgi:hypothetical protein